MAQMNIRVEDLEKVKKLKKKLKKQGLNLPLGQVAGLAAYNQLKKKD